MRVLGLPARVLRDMSLVAEAFVTQLAGEGGVVMVLGAAGGRAGGTPPAGPGPASCQELLCGPRPGGGGGAGSAPIRTLAASMLWVTPRDGAGAPRERAGHTCCGQDGRRRLTTLG